MKNSLRLLFLVALAAGPAFSTFAADAKRVIVVTVTTGFRHSSIPYAEKTLQKLGEESGVFTVVDFARQPDVQVPRKPNPTRDRNSLNPPESTAATIAMLQMIAGSL